MEYLLGSLITGIVSIVMFYFRSREAAKVKKICDTRTSRTSDLKSGKIAAKTSVEVKGKVITDRALTAPLSKRQCVYYSFSVKEEIKETSYSGRRGRSRTRTIYNTLESGTVAVNFQVQDHTGEIMVAPQGAEIDGVISIDRREPVGSSGGALGFIGSLFSFPGRRVVAIKKHETIIPLNARVYVLGEFKPVPNNPWIGKPDKGLFLISTQTEEQLVECGRRSMLWLLVGAVFFMIVSAVVASMGILYT